MTEVDEAAGETDGDENLSDSTQSGALSEVTSEVVADDTTESILVRATVHLPGLPLGRETYVDPTNPEIQGYLSSEFLVRVESAGSPT